LAKLACAFCQLRGADMDFEALDREAPTVARQKERKQLSVRNNIFEDRYRAVGNDAVRVGEPQWLHLSPDHSQLRVPGSHGRLKDRQILARRASRRFKRADSNPVLYFR